MDGEARVIISGARPDQLDYLYAWLEASGVGTSAIEVRLRPS